MWTWIKNLWKSLRSEEWEEEEREQRVSTPPVQNNRIQAKTKSIYPKERPGGPVNETTHREKPRQFRFPVIPDQKMADKRVTEDVGKQAEHSRMKQDEKERHNPQPFKQVAPQKPKVAPLEEKPAFKMNEVYSPVYGRLENRPKQEQDEVIRPIRDRSNLSNVATKAEEDAAKSELASFFLPRFGEREETEVPVHTEVTDDTQTLGDWHTEDKDTPRIEDELPNVEIAASIQSESAKAVEMDLVELELEPSAALTEEGYEQQESEEWEEEQIAVGEAVEAVEVEGEGVPSETVHLEDEQPVAEGVFHEHEASVSEPDEAIGLPGTTEAHESMEFPDPIEQSVSTAPPLSPVVMSFPIMASPVQAPFGQSGREEKQDHAEEWESKAKEEEAHHSEEQGDLKQAYVLPDETLLTPSPQTTIDDEEYTFEQKRLLEETLSNFNVNATVVGIVKGPSVTRFELQPAPGVKVNKITGLSDDIKLNLSAKDIRIEAPIPGRNAVGIEVPNVKSVPVFISRIIESETFRNHPSPLAIALGMDIGGEPIVADIKKMPHGLIAGSTGSGKSVCINSIIVSLLYKATPEQVRLLLIDPKMVELAPYNHLPHLITPVVTDAKQATASLKWAVEEMERRYAAFVEAGVRDVDRYNQTTDEPLPYIVIIIDELADLMMVAPQDVEDCIIRIAQKARACGIHLLLATQRPSVDVITGNIKANVPTRLAFAVFSQIDSRTILDQSGAERLLGRGDMLFLESGATPIRLQGNFVSDDEIELVTHMIKKQRKPNYLFSKEDLEQSVNSYDAGDDPLYHEALQFVADQGQASASSLQRRFRIGYNRAARLIEMMEAEGHVAGQSGGKPRAVLITREDAQALAEGTTLL